MCTNGTAAVSVIICCYTEERLQDIREAIASVQAQTRTPDEIIVAVDNNKFLYERLAAEYRGQQVKLVLNDAVRGLSATRNAGITAAGGELVAFLDDDAVAEGDWLENLLAPFDDPLIVAAGGQANLRWVKSRPAWFPEDLDWVVGGSFIGLPLDQRAVVQNPHGHNMCFRKEVFATVGMFDCSVGRVGKGAQAGEEAELCLRIKRHLPDRKIIYEPSSLIRHKVPGSRGCWKYLVHRSYQEGICKARIHQLNRLYAVQPLSRETAYLRYLFIRAIPSRLLRFWNSGALAQVTAIVVCVAATGTGYLRGRWWLRRVTPSKGQIT
jgi:glycosyltransferase involved in cell wall biosynthesis